MLGLGISANAQWPKIITFDAPGACTVPACEGAGTIPSDINPAGEIVGTYYDASYVGHGFVRAPNGEFTTFNVPGAVVGTVVTSNNPAGAIAGFYGNASLVWYAFLRAPSGKLTTFAAPGAGTGAYQGTGANCINPAGAIAGSYTDEYTVDHGYLRTPDGKITIFDAPDAGSEQGQGTNNEWAVCMNPAGAITGYYVDNNWVGHGYVRAPDGAVTEFDAPGAGTTAGSTEGTYAWGISANGTIVGFVQDTNELTHGFIRSPFGRFTTFDVPGAGTVVGSWQGTWPMDINSAGAITGYYADASWVCHGFLRAPDGRITKFDVPGAGNESGQGTYPMTINSAGAVTGYYLDSAGVYHGFLRTGEDEEGGER
jgi:hypothetical protein